MSTTSMPRVLVVSYNIPRPDKSSGEQRFSTILEILSESWDIDFCIPNSILNYNEHYKDLPYIQNLLKKGIRVLPFKKDTFYKAISQNRYAGGYFNFYWIAENTIRLFKKIQPWAFTIVDSVDVHFAREETQLKFGIGTCSQVLQTKKRELLIYKSADVTIAVSKDDFKLLSEDEGLSNVVIIPNIVKEYPRKEGRRKSVVVFIGSYAWPPNPDAVKWFSSLIWPKIISVKSEAEFLIIGSEPTPEVIALADIPGIKVLGYVPDTSPYLEIAAVSVAPLRQGGGMKGKVNEAMAHGVPVVSTTIGAQGFDAVHQQHMMITDDPDEFASCVISLLDDDILQHKIGLAGQQLNSEICSYAVVKERISNLISLCNLLTPKTINRTQLQINSLINQKTQITKNIRNVFRLLRHERLDQIIKRARLCLNRQNLQKSYESPKQESYIKYRLIKPLKILEFPIITEKPFCSIIIAVYNQWEYTHACLASILKNSNGISYEILLIDDNSTDETRFVDRFVKNIRVIRNESNIGFLFSCNNGAKLANGKYIIFLNNDTLVQPEWLKWFMKVMKELPDVGLVGAKLVFSSGKLQEAGGIVFQDGSALNYGRDDHPDRPQYNYFKDVDYCSGSCICVKKELWEKANGFDPQYAPAYYEDTDLAMQIRAMGYRTVYQPKSIIVHFEGISHGTDIKKGIKKKQIDNQKIFYSKWNIELETNSYKRNENLFNARDRSKNKKTVLLIDYTIPIVSYLAPEEKSIQMISYFTELSFNIKFMPDDFFRKEPYVSELEQKGIEVLYGAWYKQNWQMWFTENSRYFNAICFIDESIAKKYLSSFQRIGGPDLSFSIFDQPFNLQI